MKERLEEFKAQGYLEREVLQKIEYEL